MEIVPQQCLWVVIKILYGRGILWSRSLRRIESSTRG